MLGDGFVLNFLPYFTVFGWKIYWYGVIIACGFLLAVWYSTSRVKTFGITQDDIIDLVLWCVPLAIVCARLYYVIFYRENGVNPYFDGEHDLKDILTVWNGGLAIYGGIIGGIIGAVITAKLKKIRFSVFADVGALGLLIGQAIGRWGNFTNREAHGVDTKLPWRMGLVYSFKTFYFHPTFLYESLWNALGFVILHFYSKKRKYDGEVFLLYAAWYGLGRAMIEGLRTDSLYVGQSNLRVSQLIGILSCIGAIGIMLYIRMSRHPEPEDLWVNRGKKESILAAEAAAYAQKQKEKEEEAVDEELSDAFRILNMKYQFDKTAEETVSEVPSVAPVDYHEAPEVAEELEKEFQNEEGHNDETNSD